MTEYTVFKLDDANQAYCIREINASSVVEAKNEALEKMPKNDDNIVITLPFGATIAVYENNEWEDWK